MTSRVTGVMAWQPDIPGWNLPDPGEVSWQDGALCAQTDPEAFFIERGGDPRPAKRVCAVCPVRAECLEFALENDIRHGIWGGLSERERRRIRAGRERESGAVRCASGRHLLTGGNVLPNGKCAACRAASLKSAEGLRLVRGLAA